MGKVKADQSGWSHITATAGGDPFLQAFDGGRKVFAISRFRNGRFFVEFYSPEYQSRTVDDPLSVLSDRCDDGLWSYIDRQLAPWVAAIRCRSCLKRIYPDFYKDNDDVLIGPGSSLCQCVEVRDD